MSNKTGNLRENDSRWTIFIRDLELSIFIGIDAAELAAPQLVRISLACDYLAPIPVDNKDTSQVVDYGMLVKKITSLVQNLQKDGGQHVYLVETLAHAIASLCLCDSRIITVWVRVEKPTVIQGVKSVGVEITRTQLKN